ncbi:MAG: D-arabinose 5-phosphate isomerase [Gammaproteobacteria bacterium RIFCSPHIGHO2_02_FULL_39_13]|nr:MAG: D-arabinose 5-phosphate isomerase [Gammaproteobacteria bacterium RIFCSPHIGHO2_02_FULL_39_13]OGT49296.1 MAG: D-arabinose 5-phosphate isomerase [Gammaproteobacteria bacterium RIFCSPHIGHO2_12_FULL_39_24]
MNAAVLSSELSTAYLCQLGRQVVDIETQSVANLIVRIDKTYADACRLLLQCQGRVILIGMGKSGHIARKIAATLASTGTASYFVHPAEANHGDLGMLAPGDIVIAISNSGETEEILTLLPIIKLLDIPIIAMTGDPHSSLANYATIHLDIHVDKEACPLGLAPTSSTTAALVMGDAIAITLLEARGFKARDFARYHPGGSLGRRLLLRVEGLMRAGEQLPLVTEHCLLSNALLEITQKSLGMTTIVNSRGELTGIFTDGDLRRSLDQNVDIRNTPIHQIMTKKCVTISKNNLAAEALQIMEQHKITSLVVIENQKPIGVVHMHDLLRAGIG